MPPGKQSAAEALAVVKTEIAVLDERLNNLQKQIERLDLTAVLQKLAVLEAQVVELKRAKEESDKRQWQFVYIFAGAMASLLVTVVVQLVLGLVKKP